VTNIPQPDIVAVKILPSDNNNNTNNTRFIIISSLNRITRMPLINLLFSLYNMPPASSR
jgi:hypothetical protein